jgi:hypothetical protein
VGNNLLNDLNALSTYALDYIEMTIPLDQLFASTSLTVNVPESSFEFPPTGLTEDWLNSIRSESKERRQAFFGEQLCISILLTGN